MERLKVWLDKQKKDERSVILFLIKGYFLTTVLCFLFLLLPFCQNSSNSIVNHLFFSVSIVSTTGLVPADFAGSYNLLGQIISLLFIQLGGVGYMALSSFIILKQSDRLPSLSVKLLRLEFNLPQKYPLAQFIYSVFIFTVLIESIGTVFLYFGFKSAGIDQALWYAIFHSISAFCTAGFSLFGDSMTSFQDNPLITYTILVLSLLGSIGFIVLLDFWLKIIGKRTSITLTSKIILASTFTFIAIGTILIYFSDAALLAGGWSGFRSSLFQTVSAHTTVGFNNFDVGQFSLAACFVMILLMVIGASPAGTGGGIKTTSISALFAVLISILKRRKHITFFDKEIPDSNIYLAVSSAIFYTIILVLGIWGLLMIDGNEFGLNKLTFEAASALSTVGISTGITGELSDPGKLVIALLMFVGRLGVLTFGFALISKSPLMRAKPQIEDIAI